MGQISGWQMKKRVNGSVLMYSAHDSRFSNVGKYKVPMTRRWTELLRGICVTEVSQKSEVNTSGLQVLHVLGPGLPLLQRRKVQSTHKTTINRVFTRHSVSQKCHRSRRCSTSESTEYPCTDGERLGGASVDRSTTEVGGNTVL